MIPIPSETVVSFINLDMAIFLENHTLGKVMKHETLFNNASFNIVETVKLKQSLRTYA